ncbi:uncharacterized protein LOC141714397 [Apium graveolens]|uniref:uncharacterized protein LOC141714397 n=1 Tax=Apium graveolens TaxID=4045 RepID=UPI003D7B0CD5
MEASSPSFPCEDEQIVASALLLLSTPPLSISSSTSCYDNNMSLLLASSKSYDSSTSVMTIDEASSASFQPLRVVCKFPLSVPSREMKLKVVRKSRSKNLRISDCRKATSGKLATVSWGSETRSEASSCLSSTTSTSISSVQTCKTTVKKAVETPHLHRRADSIMNLLAHRGGISEIRIRQFLGDSPDTSKALRMLMKQAAVKRSGAGGRSDPYIYMIA